MTTRYEPGPWLDVVIRWHLLRMAFRHSDRIAEKYRNAGRHRKTGATPGWMRAPFLVDYHQSFVPRLTGWGLR